MWEGIALLALVVVIAGACVWAGQAISKSRLEIEQARNAMLNEGIRQGGKAAEATGDVLKKVREREYPHSGPLDRDAIERLFGGRGPETDPPGRPSAGPGGRTPQA